MNFIILKSFDNTIDAHLLKSKLESEDIICHLKDEYITNAYQQYSYPFGGVKLMVYEDNYKQALELLESLKANNSYNGKQLKTTCPNCNSNSILKKNKYKNSFTKLFSIVMSLLFSLVIINPKSKYKCNYCNYEYKL
ncbi:MAG: DUF2007 domain-containing protein [Chlorobiota bacterium]